MGCDPKNPNYKFMPISHINYRNGPSVSFGTYVHWSLKYQRFYHQIAKILGFLNFLFVCDKNPIFCEIFCNSLLQTKFFSNSVPEKNWEESRLVVSHFFVFVLLEIIEGLSWRNATPLWRIQSVSWTLGNSGLPSVYVTRDLAYMFSAILNPPPFCRTKYYCISRGYFFPGVSISTFMILKRKYLVKFLP